jgi:hypothetical protein
MNNLSELKEHIFLKYKKKPKSFDGHSITYAKGITITMDSHFNEEHTLISTYSVTNNSHTSCHTSPELKKLLSTLLSTQERKKC